MANQHTYDDDFKIKVAEYYLSNKDGYEKCGLEFGVGRDTVWRWVKQFRHQIEYGIKDDQRLKGVSTYTPVRDEEGTLLSATWTKVDIAHEDAIEKLISFANGIKDDIPQCTVTPQPKEVEEDLLTLYMLTDAHIGMRSEEWSMEIAEKMIIAWIHEAITSSPDSHTAVFCLMGDIAHFDSLYPVTPKSGHVLEADCNAREMNRLIIKLVRYCVAQLLKKHQEVKIIYACGNHDEYTAVIQSEWISAHYDNEPRITVDIENTMYHCIEWGDISLFMHHGHKRRLSDIDRVFAGTFRDVFGRTRKSYGHIGHFHHTAKGESQLMEVEIHPTLTGKDDYAKWGGWLSHRAANVITYHKTLGKRRTSTIPPELLV